MGKGRISNHGLWSTATNCFTTTVLTSEAVDMSAYRGAAMVIDIALAGTGTNSVSIKMTSCKTATGTFATCYNTAGVDIGDIVAVGSEITTSRRIEFSPIMGKFIKIVVTGSAANGAATTVAATLTVQADN